MAGYTPGPWMAEPCPCGWAECRSIMSPCEKVAESVREANARLIAAAPELLEHLRFAVKLLRPWAGGTAQVQAMEAAIAKAEGSSSPSLLSEEGK